MTTLRTSGIVLDHTSDGWGEYKKYLDGTYSRLPYVWVDEGPAYSIAAMDGLAVRVCGINKADATDFEDNFKGSSGGVEPRQIDRTPLVALQGRVGREVIFTSHNLCDKTTWFSESERVTDQELTLNGGTGWWESPDENWIDLVHGKLFDEDAETLGDPVHCYAVVVTVDAVEKTARAPFATSGGDYEIDYTNGKVKPFTEDWSGKTVLASYSKCSGSGSLLTPLPGRTIVMEKAEVNFSKDIGYTDAVHVEIWGAVDYFAPHLLDTADPPGPYPSGTPIPIETTRYKSIDQMIDEAIGAFPEIPALSSGLERGFTSPRYLFQFYYASVRKIFSSLGMFMRITTGNGTQLGGERATATFYCLSAKDPGPEAAMATFTQND